jgi:protein XagA
VLFDKLLVQNSFEYGLTNAVTLYAAPEYVMAQSGGEGQETIRARSVAVEAGARILLLTRIGMFSIQGSAKTAGAFDMSYGKTSGSQAELRLLYGTNYKLLGLDGFTDLQVAERWIRRPRPNEMTIDATLGLWLTPKTLAMFKSYNIVGGGGVQAPYTFYRMHKLELSVVRRITGRWSVQVGAFASPLGQNIVAEQGIGSALWYRF